MSTTVTPQPATLNDFFVSLAFVSPPSGWVNWPHQRSMLASIVPPAPMTVIRPAGSSPSEGTANSASIIPDFG